jgi:CRISPR-associated protein Csy2
MYSDTTLTGGKTPELHPHLALLVLPRLRVQNANAISSPLTWGFPAITAFTGFMTALERHLGPEAGISFHGVGVICHAFEAQVTQGGYTHSFCLTRNPILKDGGTAAIVEEGRVHLDITLVLDVRLSSTLINDTARTQLATHIGDVVAGMRLAGGSVMPPLPGTLRHSPRPQLMLLSDDEESRSKHFRRLSRRWLPGFALVSRDDVLHKRLSELQASATPDTPQPTLLDAWLDLSRINHRATVEPQWNAASDSYEDTVQWRTDSRPGWLVPIPVGFAALSEAHPPGTVARARDPSVPFRFVESVYSIGQWISPHRLRDTDQLIWKPSYDEANGLYRCTNDFQQDASSACTQVSETD